MQIVRLSEDLRLDLSHLDDDEDGEVGDDYNDEHYYKKCKRLYTIPSPLHPKRLRPVRNNFPRTEQSVQDVLTGLFPDRFPSETNDDDDATLHIDIDVWHTDVMIPSP